MFDASLAAPFTTIEKPRATSAQVANRASRCFGGIGVQRQALAQNSLDRFRLPRSFTASVEWRPTKADSRQLALAAPTSPIAINSMNEHPLDPLVKPMALNVMTPPSDK
jgi:hypothetical protein